MSVSIVGDPTVCAKHGCKLGGMYFGQYDERVCPQCHHSGAGCPTHPQALVWKYTEANGAVSDRCAICGYWHDGREPPPEQESEYRTFAHYRAAVARSDKADFPLQYHAGCLGEEAGEFFGKVKKVVWHGHPLDEAMLEKMREELGDLLWYLDRSAHRIGATLEQIAAENIRKLARRYPDGFSAERSRNRVPAAPSCDCADGHHPNCRAAGVV